MSSKQTIAALIEHEGFVRSLARSLVPDRALAEDLAQDTWVAALRHPPAASGSPRGWLASVMRNQLRDWRRGDSRRSRREALAARPAEVDASEGLWERLERGGSFPRSSSFPGLDSALSEQFECRVDGLVV
ncbi:MAG: hypothetical protein GY711_35730 [bacterium]|nr:hypothetical protein [bacterium]